MDTTKALLELCRRSKRPLAADLFCGAGGLSQGLTEAGFEVVLGVDTDKEALETHRAHHPGLTVDWDLGDEDAIEATGRLIRRMGVTLVAGGPPCQAFSRAGRSALRDMVRQGRRPAHDLRRDLWQSFLRIVSVARPPAVIMENVPEMALDRDMWILRSIVDELEAMGYAVEERVVSTSDYGVPQFRQRLILVALAKRTAFTWPEPVTGVNLRGAIGDLPPVEGGFRPENGDDPADPVASGWVNYPKRPRTDFQRRMRRDMGGYLGSRVYDHITRPVREDDAQVFAIMDSGTRYSDLDPELRRYRADIFDDKYKRLDWNGLSRTITAHIAKDGYGFIHPEQERTITVREAARIQTFPDDYRFAGTPSAAFRQIGNAVPPFLGENLGRAVLGALADGKKTRRLTRSMSTRLADWFESRDELRIPWLRARTRWQVLTGEALCSRLSSDHVREMWLACESIVQPEEFLEPTTHRALGRLASLRDRPDQFAGLTEAASYFIENPRALSPSAWADNLSSAPHVTVSAADLAVRVLPGLGEDRDELVLATHGVLRVAARVFGENVDRQNRLSDGRLGVARLIGSEDLSHEAHLGLIELANSHCAPGSRPDCSPCPLRDFCAFAAEPTG
ncbi:MAG: DNA cytosine methyltransferase [Acidimicrobiales bacterium]